MVKKTSKKKVPKDPNAPKKPTCAYFFFQIVRRNQLKDEYPNLTNTEVVIQLGKDWNSLTDLHKLPFEKLSEADKARYDMEMEQYRLEHPELAEAERDEDNNKPVQETKEKKKSSKRNKKASSKNKKVANRKKESKASVINDLISNDQAAAHITKPQEETKKKRSKPVVEAAKKKSKSKPKAKEPQPTELENNNETSLELKEDKII